MRGVWSGLRPCRGVSYALYDCYPQEHNDVAKFDRDWVKSSSAESPSGFMAGSGSPTNDRCKASFLKKIYVLNYSQITGLHKDL